MNRILVVDDEKNNLKAIQRLLKGSPYALEFALSGEEALGKAPVFKPDLIILDIMMPGMNGYEVCRMLRAETITSESMILFLSAKGTLKDKLEGYNVKADDYLCKPYEPEELKAKIEILLRLKHTQDALRDINNDLETVVRLKTRELARKERQALIGQMIQGFVHNLQNPMMVALGRSNNARRVIQEAIEKVSNEQNELNINQYFEDALAEIGLSIEAIDIVEHLIKSLLIKSKDEAIDKVQHIDINDLIIKELEFLDGNLEFKHRIKKTVNLAPALPNILGIYTDISQLMHNLITNAADAMKHSNLKELTITSQHDRENIYIRVEDSGEGIPLDIQEKIFNPFFTTKSEKNIDVDEYSGGTGLGLYTCRETVHSYGGTISFSSDIGKGSVFTIKLPKNTFVMKNV